MRLIRTEKSVGTFAFGSLGCSVLRKCFGMASRPTSLSIQIAADLDLELLTKLLKSI